MFPVKAALWPYIAAFRIGSNADAAPHQSAAHPIPRALLASWVVRLGCGRTRR
jgi:hypothetical protein